MFFALGRLMVIGFVVLTVIYFCLALYSRAVRKDKLEKQWLEEGSVGDQEAFVDAGLEEYEGSLRRKLRWGVYIVPVTLVIVIVYLTNYS